MTFNEWWCSLTTREENSMDKEGAMAAWEFGKLEAVQRVMDVWVDSNTYEFSVWLREYLEELK